jgi:23S rRNA (adenine2503-C2)-methyltransferase
MNKIQLEELVVSLGGPPYRARQLQSWIYHNLAGSFEEMANLPEAFRQKIASAARLQSLTLIEELTDRDGTIKVLFSLTDGRTIESAMMFYPASDKIRATVCLSTQVGCAIGCPFCATGQQGFERNLTAGEIIDQVLYFARELKSWGKEPYISLDKTIAGISNIVFMGMGEPLANYDAVWQAIQMLNSPQGFGLGARNMVISTAGLISQIEQLSRERLQVGLAVSLHASDNTLRDKLVPVNRKYPLEQLIPACREYFERTGRRVSFEYILFSGINDSPQQALALAALLRGLNCHVNLIPANNTASEEFKAPRSPAITAFAEELIKQHIVCTVRQSRGKHIKAGCGQLRSRYLQQG